MTPKLTILEILRKHFDHAPRGAKTRCAEAVGVSQKDFSRWLAGVTTPSGDYAVQLLQHLNELRHYKKQ